MSSAGRPPTGAITTACGSAPDACNYDRKIPQGSPMERAMAEYQNPICEESEIKQQKTKML